MTMPRISATPMPPLMRLVTRSASSEKVRGAASDSAGKARIASTAKRYMLVPQKLGDRTADEGRKNPCAEDENGTNNDIGEIRVRFCYLPRVAARENVFKPRIHHESDDNRERDHDDRL